jgi:hypothetical protein
MWRETVLGELNSAFDAQNKERVRNYGDKI